MYLQYEFSCPVLPVIEIVKVMKKHGIVHIPGFINRNELEKLNSEFDKVLTGPTNSILNRSPHPRNPEGLTARISPWREDAIRDFPCISQVFRSDLMREVADCYFSPHPVDLNDEVFVTHEMPAENAILPWHFDRIQSIKFWFNLTDTTAQNGAFEYCPGTHWEGHYRAGFHLSQGCGVEDIPNDIDEDLIRNPVTLELKAGDLLIFDSDGFHRGGIVQPGQERRVLRGHTHPRGVRRYRDKPLSTGWWLKSFLNLNKWAGGASRRSLGDRVKDRAINRKMNKF